MDSLPSGGSHFYSTNQIEDNDNNRYSATPAMDTPNFISHSTNHFAISFMNAVPANVSENVAFSPWSMINLLGMILLGTVDKSKSQKEFYEVLDIPEKFAHLTHNQLQDTFGQISPTIAQNSSQGQPGVQVDQANFILYNSLVSSINQDYSKDLRNYYDAKVEDFKPGVADPRGAVHERVNSLVNRVTRGMIKDIADPSLSSRSDLAIVLLNAAYFKGQWKDPFEIISKSIFHNSGNKGKPKEVDFMMREDDYRFGEFPPPPLPDDLMPPNPSPEEVRRNAITSNLHCKVLELPYALNEGKDFSMLVLLPSALDGVEALQRQLTPLILQTVYDSLSSSKVQVRLPKFNLETKYEPKDSLLQLGLSSIFGASHDLDRMLEGKQALKIDEIIHKTNIKVDEKGSEAASASVAFISYASYYIPQSFKADHPFLFIIRHNPTNTPLFMGRVSSL